MYMPASTYTICITINYWYIPIFRMPAKFRVTLAQSHSRRYLKVEQRGNLSYLDSMLIRASTPRHRLRNKTRVPRVYAS